VAADKLFQFEDLRDRVIVITGGAMGIGRGLSRGLAGQGSRLILVDRDEKNLAENAGWLRSAGANVQTRVCDLSDPAQRQKLSTDIAKSNPTIDGIIHNAAIDPRMALADMTTDFFRRVIATDVEPAMDITRGLLPNLKKSGRGRVIMIGSITFDVGTALLSAYVAAKGAVVGLTRSFAHELGPDGITVNCIAPGAIRVEKEAHQYSPELDRAILGWQSVKRRLDPEDLLGLVCLLLSSAGSAINGQVINVDGGLLHPIADAAVQRPMVEPQ
jgi:NAD(P)-dependent dehydrogenase (short-subunit alcohol dehydrogenase family)